MSAEHLRCDSLSASHLDSRNSRCRPILPDRSHVLFLCELLQTHPHKHTVTFILYCKTLLLLLKWDVWVRLGTGLGRFKGRFRCTGYVNSVIINVITDVITCRYLKKRITM